MPPALPLRTRPSAEGSRHRLPRAPRPPFSLPGLVDRMVEGWWRLAPRTRGLLVAGAVALLLAAVLLRVALSPYGQPVQVLVATRDLAAGGVAGPADVRAVRWPEGLLLGAAPATRADLAGARLTTGVLTGTLVTRAHLQDAGPLARLRAGAVAVPVPSGLLVGVAADTRLDLLAVSGDGSGRTLALDVRVLAVDGPVVWVELPRERAGDVAAAALRGTLSGAILAP